MTNGAVRCTCGDPECHSCGPAQGYWGDWYDKCPVCLEAMDDGIDHSECLEAHRKELARLDRELAIELDDTEKLAKEFWREERKAGRCVPPRYRQSSLQPR